MTDDVVKDDELEEVEHEGAIPDFIPNTPAPIGDDDLVDEDLHASFDHPVAQDDSLSDIYGVGAPKIHHDEYDDEEDEEVLDETFDTSASDAY